MKKFSVERVCNDRRLQYGLFIFGILCLAYLFVTFHRVSPAIIAVDIMRDIHIDGTTMGIMSSVFFLTFGFMQLPSGILADSLGPRRTLPLFFSLAGLGAIAFGNVDSVGWLMLSRALMGLGVSVVFVCGVKLIGNWFPPELFARMNGLYLGMGGAGLILGAGPMAYLCNMLGWRSSLSICGFLTILISVALWIWVRDKPEDKGFGAQHSLAAAAPAAPAMSIRDSVLMISRNRQFWCVAIWFFCHFALQNSFGGLWGGPYLIDVHGMSRVEAGNVLNMMGVGMLAGGPFAGWLSDSFFKARRPVMLLYAVALAATFAVLAFAGQRLPVWGLYVWFFCLAACGMGSLSVGFAAVRDIFGPSVTGTASGFLNMLPSIGVVALQPLTGWILELQGKSPSGGFLPEAYSTACYMYIATAVVGFVAAAMLREPTRAAGKR